MSEISCKLFEFFERHAEAEGYPVESLLEGTGLTLATLHDPSAFVPWAQWSRMIDRFGERLGSEQALILAGRSALDMEFWRPAATLGRALSSVPLLYGALVRWLGPTLFRSFEFTFRRVEPGRFRLVIEQPATSPPCRNWFLILQGTVAAVSSLVDQVDARVVLEQVDHQGIYHVWVPASGAARVPELPQAPAASALPAVSDVSAGVGGAGDMLEELGQLTDEVRRAYREARAAEDQLRDLLAALPDPMAVRVEGRLVFENPAWREVFGPTVEDHGLPRALLPHRALLDGHRDVEEVIQITIQDQPRAMACAPTSRLRWGEAQGALLVLRDVTAARDAAERRELEDRLRSLGTVAAGVGHEINNPLAYALGELEVLEGRAIDGNVTPGELRSGLSTVREAILRVRDISRDLLTFGRPPKGFEPTDARATIDAALRLAGAQLRHSVKLRVVLPDAPMVVSARPGELAQVFLNLAINARDAMADQPEGRRRLIVRGRTEGETHIFTFADSGPGVPVGQRARLFEPYFTTKGDGGTGLGLAVCAKITREHGGEIGLIEGPGAVFEIRLPRLDAVLPEAAPRPPPQRVRRRLRVLVVDDQVRFATLLPRLLPRHAVVCEHTAEAALARLAAGEHFDVLLCDVMMPGMNGPTLHRRLLDAAPELARRTLFVTGGAFDGGAQRYLEAAGQPVLGKPYERRALVDAIEAVVAAADAEDGR